MSTASAPSPETVYDFSKPSLVIVPEETPLVNAFCQGQLPRVLVADQEFSLIFVGGRAYVPQSGRRVSPMLYPIDPVAYEFASACRALKLQEEKMLIQEMLAWIEAQPSLIDQPWIQDFRTGNIPQVIQPLADLGIVLEVSQDYQATKGEPDRYHFVPISVSICENLRFPESLADSLP